MLEVESLSKRFGGLAAVQDISFEARQGEILSIIGPNGAGKTTIFNLITGFLDPSAGRIAFLGRDITGVKPHRAAGLGLVRTFQKTNVFAKLSVLENVIAGQYLKARVPYWRALFPGRLMAEREAAVRAEALRLIVFLKLAHRLETTAENLPYGELRRLEIAIALAAGPKLLLLDEPAAGLNTAETDDLAGLLREINRDWGLSILLVEHNMKVVMQVSDRVVVLNFGRKLAQGTPEKIRKDPEVIAAYLGVDEDAQGAG